MKKTESEPIELNNHEKMVIRKLAKEIKRAEIERKARIEREDAEDNQYRRKIVK